MGLRSLLDVAAPAKLNLFLHVVGRRADGYHLLQSVFVLIDWCDTLHFERRADGRLARHDLGAALPDDDLCLRAARLLQAESGTRLGADISIDKHVPWGAGMGGGSSDAASTLLALNRLWGLNLPRERLAALGLKLGADVPFFIGGHNAFVEGIGERLTPLPVPRAWFAVVKPPAAIATSAIFGSPLLVRNTEAVILAGFLADTAGGFGRNDLQAPAEAHCAEVGVAREILQRRFGNARMTGSGSAVFARAGTGAEPTAAMPADLPPGWVGRMCRSLEQHPLVGWAPD
ncbi:MAG TPA: 4-(cytidine 5'-diphospho)-2-C-methyl-D-erythritol kinase [Piscinibacter sp.]|uniref:4-(cytidine 5'-diphospho)-2-C-methyl-D-erythritol kinase n=1 Tax=Piscinibacter sp. TaxID=1903157 RepID=UPI002BABD3B6|nr:4-(cytidine 5'-diphospho)-2-C-methyl-D-erythritol kinase [Piscinibacter sp.]HNK17497.1 4-(cytidine 5'-diphospho)-2-C-methyl-D-erythritol kinase [Piscinibacter sp.]